MKSDMDSLIFRSALALAISSLCPISVLGQSGNVVLLQVEGVVTVERDGWPTPQTIGTGAILRTADLLYARPGGDVTILCPDLESVWRLPVGLRRSSVAGCPTSPPESLSIGRHEIMRPRATDDAELILAPRGAIRDTTPLLRWKPFGNTRRYLVQIVLDGKDRRVVWGPVLADGFEQEYPSSSRIHAFRPGQGYFVQVRPYRFGDFISSDVPFVLLPEEGRLAIEQALQRLSESLGQGTARFALAASVRLAAAGAFEEALGLLDAATENVASSSAVTLLGARLAEALGLDADSEKRFERARNQAIKEGIALIEAEALEGLARVGHDFDHRRQLYREALERWSFIGDEDAAQRVRSSLEALARQVEAH